MSLSSLLLLFVGGICAGTFGALLGLGGGVFLVPFLVLAFGLPMHQAIATSIIAVIATSSAGATVNLERHTVNIRLGMLLETGTVLGAIFGGLTANYLSGQVLGKIFAMLLFLVSLVMIWRTRHPVIEEHVASNGILPGTFWDEARNQRVAYSVKRLPSVMGVSLIAGNISGLLGIGGGIFKVPAMTMLGGIPIKAATATSNFMIGVTAAASAFIYFAHGHVNPAIASSTALGVLGGSLLGVKISRKIHSTVLSWIFAGVLIVVSLQMFWR